MSLITVIIDDDPVMCFIHQRLLNQPQFALDPLIFQDGQQALEYFLENYKEENEYLILLDIHMPVMNGWGFLQEMNREFQRCNLHVFIVSSSYQVSEQQNAIGFSQVVGFMEKPLNAENLEKIRAKVHTMNLAKPSHTQHFEASNFREFTSSRYAPIVKELKRL